MGNVAEVAPPGTATVAGTVATFVLVEVNETNVPPAGAGLDNVTSPCPLLPAPMLLGKSVRLPSEVGATVSNLVWPTPFAEADMVNVIDDETAVVTMLKFAEVCPAGTVTFGATVATDGSLLPSVTSVPPVGAGPFNSTVPVVVCPPAISLGKISKLLGTTPGVTRK